jgi:hypothetical protein
MLILDAKVCFDKPSENPSALLNDLNTENIIRPAINFGNNLLFSGTIRTKERVDKIIRGEVYNVLIEMPTIEEQEYQHVQHLVKIGKNFTLQNASKIIGKGEIIEFIIHQN